MKDLLKYLNALIKQKCAYEQEEFIPYEAFGGNIDDAYFGGINDGRIQLAREILAHYEEIKKPNKILEDLKRHPLAPEDYYEQNTDGRV